MRLAKISDGVLEACWLLALVLAPLFFDTYSARVFEPDKIALVRSLALVTLAAWLARAMATNIRPALPERSTWASWWRVPLALPIVVFAGVVVLATVFSLAPEISLFGSYQRMQGTFTTFSYLVLALSVAAHLRTRTQVERIVTTVIVTSLPIALYGLLQRNQLDPLPWGGETVERVTGHMGNAIFLAAYLIMAALLALGRLTLGFRALLTRAEDAAENIVRTAAYVFIFVLDLAAIWFTQSRGPQLGLLLGGFFFFILVALHYRVRWLALTAVGLGLAGVVFLGVLNVANGPLSPLCEVRGVNRLCQMAAEIEDKSGTGRVRVLIWTGVTELITPHEPLENPITGADPWNAIRPLIGYGPETLHVAYNRFYPPELGTLESRNASPDRSHNETFDALATTGLLGLLAYLGLFTGVFYYALKWLGLIETTTFSRLFLGLWLGGGAIGAAIFVGFFGWPLFGIGLPLGLLGGLTLFLTVWALRAGAERTASLESWRAIIMIALFSAIVAHFFEIHIGIAIVSTRTHFWIFLAVLWVLGWYWPQRGPIAGAVNSKIVEPNARKRRRSEIGRAQTPAILPLDLIGPAAGLVLVILSTLAFDFIANSARATDTATILANALTAIQNGSQPSAGVLLLFGFTWLVGATLAVLEARAGRADVAALAVIPTVAGLAAIGTVVVMLILAGQHEALANTRFATVEDLVASGDVVAGLLTGFYATLLVIGGLWALTLGSDSPAPRSTPGWAWLMAAGATVLALVGAVALNLRVIQADVIYKTAQQIETDGYPDVAARLYERVIAMAPSQDFYYLFLGRAYLSSTTLVEATQRQSLLETAQAQLLDAQQINPYNTDHTANLARLHREWARTSGDGAERSEHARIANDYYDRATRLSPNNAGLWNEWSLLSYQLLGDPAAAQSQLDRSLAIDSTFDQTYLHLGDFRSWEAGQASDGAAKTTAFEQAIAAYETGLERNKGQGTAALQMRLGLAVALVNLERINEAIAQYEIVAQANIGANQWQLQRALAALYAQIGDNGRALEYAQQALTGAPDANKPEVQQFIDGLSALTP
ncbi:MAG TPA: tetratricopeptide repeat protein [Anaerolineales bacterium]|nr:tetratricopeptide repeat protein [Anaerolineales bacterium]